MIEKSLNEYIRKRIELEKLEFNLHTSGIKFQEAYDEVMIRPYASVRPFIPKHLRGPRQ